MSEEGFPFDRRKRSWRIAKLVLLAASLAAAAALGSFVALSLFESDELPDVGVLADHRPNIITRIHAGDDAQVIGDFAEERRIVVSYEELPEKLLQAIVAVEDADFFAHSGLNLRGILRAAFANAKAGRVVEGGSSLTQQLAKLMFLTPERSLARKLNEAVLALHIERSYSKEEILGFYANHVYFGHNRYGVEAASQLYFGKHVSDIGVAECALLAGLPQRPNAYSPYRSPEAARTRRDHVLARMAEEHFITDEELAEALAVDVTPRPFRSNEIKLAPHFVEEVRQHLETHYGEKRLYHDGLEVFTTLDPALQVVAERALTDGILAFDRRHGWRRSTTNVLRDDPEASLDEWSHPSWVGTPEEGQFVHAVVMAVTPSRIVARVGPLVGSVEDAPRWTGSALVGRLFEVGDVALFRVASIDEATGRIGLVVEQEPQVEGALLALDVTTGRVLAMVGGWDFARSRFNRAVQARRQTGSAFKPLVYVAALSSGFTAADVLFDEPIQITDASTGKVYSPENYSQSYYGLTTVRHALEKSRNPVSVQLQQRIGGQSVIDLARTLGITAPLQPYPSLALGAFEVTLLEMTAAYATFANNGTAYRPYFIERIEDRDGNVLSQQSPIGRPAVSPEVAYIVTSLLQGVVRSGTATRARSLGANVAGKTGTTDDFTDAWFIGYSPRIACGVWIGYDQKRSLGRGEVGAKAALPIWIDFMEAAIADPDDSFSQPPGVEVVVIDRTTGLRATSSCTDRFSEVFLRGSAPVRSCSQRDHELHALPYYLQKIALEGGTMPPMSSTPPPTDLSPTAVQTEHR